MAIGKKLRFEVFKRDSFTCQYCGAKSPDVVLHADHIHPISAGGEDDILNLITSCAGCNLGKGATKLSDASVIEKQRSQLEELQQRREQLDMLLDWKTGLLDLESESVERAAKYWSRLVPGWHLNESGKSKVRRFIAKHGLDAVLDAMKACASSHIKLTAEGKATEESSMKAFDYVPKILVSREAERTKPYMRDVFYLRGILRNVLEGNINESEAKRVIESAILSGAEFEELKELACRATAHWNFVELVRARWG